MRLIQLHACRKIVTRDYRRSGKVIRKPPVNLHNLQPIVISEMYKVSVRFVSKCFPRHMHCLFCSSRAIALWFFFSFGYLFHLGIDYPELHSLLCKGGIILSDYLLSFFNPFSKKMIFKSDALRFKACVRPNTFS